MLKFLPIDNIDALSPSLNQNQKLLVTLSSSARVNTPASNFLTSYLRHRSRWWESEALLVSPQLVTFDEAVLTALALGVRQSPTLIPHLDSSSWLDFAGLCGPSNGAPVRSILDVALAGGAIFELKSTFFSIANLLRTQIAESAAAAQVASYRYGGSSSDAEIATKTLVSSVTLIADTLASVGSLLTLSPAAAYSLQPPDGLCDGLHSLAPGSLLYEIAAAYEYTIPTLARAAARAPRTIAETLRLPLAAASYGALSALRGVIDSCYADALRPPPTSSDSGNSVAARTGIARTSPTQIITSLCGFCEAALQLKPACPPSLSTTTNASTTAPESYPPNIGVPDDTLISSSSSSWFLDATRLFIMRDTLEPLLDSAARAGLISKEMASRVASVLAGTATTTSSTTIINNNDANNNTFAKGEIALVSSVLPEANEVDIMAALTLTNGDVAAAIERLLILSSHHGGIEAEGGGGEWEEEDEEDNLPVDTDTAQRTLALVAAMETRAIAAKEEAARQRTRYGGWGMNADEARSAWLNAAAKGGDRVISTAAVDDYDDEGEEIEEEDIVPWGEAGGSDGETTTLGVILKPARGGGGGGDDIMSNRGGGRGGRGGGRGTASSTARGARSGLTDRDATYRNENKARLGNHNRKRGADKKRGRGMA